MSAHEKTTEPAADYISILSKARTLLRRHGCSFQVSLVDDAVARLRAGETMSFLTSNEFWGGSGSVADCTLPGDDNREHCRLMSELATLMVRDGLADRRVREKGYAFWFWVTNKAV